MDSRTDMHVLSCRRRHLAVLLAGAVIVLTAPAFSQSPQPIVFDRETIAVSIDTRYLRVEGTYFFTNKLGRAIVQPLFYPFPIDSLHPYPGFVEAKQSGRSLPIERREEGVVFNVALPASGVGSVTVVYEQECCDNTGCYILTTTSQWDNPLKEADFIVTVPVGIELEWMEYEAQLTDIEEDKTVYRFRRTGFAPAKDLCLRWRAADAPGENGD